MIWFILLVIAAAVAAVALYVPAWLIGQATAALIRRITRRK